VSEIKGDIGVEKTKAERERERGKAFKEGRKQGGR